MGQSQVRGQFDPEAQGLREALCILGNGYFPPGVPERKP